VTREAETLRELCRAPASTPRLNRGEDDPLIVLVPEDSLEAAKDAIEALSGRTTCSPSLVAPARSARNRRAGCHLLAGLCRSVT